MGSKALALKGIVTCPEASRGRGMKKQCPPLQKFAEENGIPCWGPHQAGDPVFLKEIAQQKCDFSLVCAYGKILPLAYLQLFPKGCLNLHLSLLPRWRGAAPVHRALMAGDQKTGVSLHIVSEGLDTGDIVGQRQFFIKEEDNIQDIFHKSLREINFLLKKELMEYLRGERQGRPQDHSKKTYAKKIDKAEGSISWQEPASAIHNKIRALFLGPQVFSFLKGQRIKIYRSKVMETGFPNFLPGEVCLVSKDKLFVACGEGALSLLELQRADKKRQQTKDFLNGFPLQLRDHFGAESPAGTNFKGKAINF